MLTRVMENQPILSYFQTNMLISSLIYRRDELGISARTICKTLGNARADVLMLNDSPFSQHVYTGHLCGPGSFELLGSGSMTSSDTMTIPTQEASFTRSLALMLDSPFLSTHGVSVVELHRKLLDTMSPRTSFSPIDRMSARMSPEPSPISPTSADSRTSFGSTATGTATLASTSTGQRESTSPTTTFATAPSASSASRARLSTKSRSYHNLKASSLIVAQGARPTSATRIPPYPVYCQIAQSTQLERDVRRNIVLSRLDAAMAMDRNWARPATEPRVWLDIRLERPFLDVRRWKEWILRAPADAKDISAKMGI